MKEDGITPGLNTKEGKQNHDHKRPDSRVRDPFVLMREDTYYLYASEGETALSFTGSC